MAKSKSKAASLSSAAAVLGSAGGFARAKALTPEELSAIGAKGAKARAKVLTPEERSRIAKRAVEARIAKYKQKRRKE